MQEAFVWRWIAGDTSLGRRGGGAWWGCTLVETVKQRRTCGISWGRSPKIVHVRVLDMIFQ